MTTNGAVEVTALDEVLPLGAVPLAPGAARRARRAHGAGPAAGGRDVVGRRAVEGAEPDSLRRRRAAGLCDGRPRRRTCPSSRSTRKLRGGSGRTSNPSTGGVGIRPHGQQLVCSQTSTRSGRDSAARCGSAARKRAGEAMRGRAGEPMTIALVVALSVTVALAVATLVFAYRGAGRSNAGESAGSQSRTAASRRS